MEIRRTMLTNATINHLENLYITEDLSNDEIKAIELDAYIANMNASNHPEWTEKDIFNDFIRILAIDNIELEEKPRKRSEIIDDIIKFFEENKDIFNEAIDELDCYNGYLGDDRRYPMGELDELMNDRPATDILNLAFFGHDDESWTTDRSGNKEYGPFNPNREYFYFNGYGNLVSCDYVDYSDNLDRWVVESMVDNRRWVDTIDDNDELSDLFDELENAED